MTAAGGNLVPDEQSAILSLVQALFDGAGVPSGRHGWRAILRPLVQSEVGGDAEPLMAPTLSWLAQWTSSPRGQELLEHWIREHLPQADAALNWSRAGAQGFDGLLAVLEEEGLWRDHAVGVPWDTVFPWVAALDDKGSGEFLALATPMPLPGSAKWRVGIRTVAQEASKVPPAMLVGQVFPRLGGGTLRQLAITPRALRPLEAGGIHTLPQLAGLPMGTLGDFPGLNPRSLESLLERLAELSADQPCHFPQAEPREPEAQAETAAVGEVAVDTAASPNRPGDVAPPQSNPTPPLITDQQVRLVAEWHQLLGHGDTSVGLDLSDLPASLVEGIGASGTAAAIAPGAPRLAGRLDELLQPLDDVESDILRQRLAGQIATLEEVAGRHGVTRERIRQRQERLRGRIRELLAADPLVSGVAGILSTGPMVEPTGALSFGEVLGECLPRLGVPAYAVLNIMDAGFEIHDGRVCRPDQDAARRLATEWLAERANRHGVVDLRPSGRELCMSPDEPWLADWLDSLGVQLVGHHAWLRRAQASKASRAAALLSMHGEPMESEGILELLGDAPSSLRSLRNQLQTSEEIVRVGLDRYALTDWGMEPYDGIQDAIRKMLVASGGSIEVEELREAICTRTGAAPASVTTFANAAPFETRRGVVRWADGTVRRGTPPAQTRRFYRRANAWLYRLTINSEHLRGSGTTTPSAVAHLLDLEAGHPIELESPVGNIRAALAAGQPQLGSIRRLLEREAITDGESVMLVFGDDRTLSVERLHVPEAHGWSRPLSLAGADPSLVGDAAIWALAEAIEFTGAVTAPEVLKAYRERRDGDIADAIASATSGPAPSAPKGEKVTATGLRFRRL